MTDDAQPRTDDQPADTHRQLCRFVFGIVIAAAASVTTANIVKARPLQSANDRSRWCTVWSLVERGTYSIDEIIRHRGWDTIDKVRFEEHFYSTKPALLPTMVAGLYAGVRAITGWNLLQQTDDCVALILFLINVLPVVAALICIAAMAERYAHTDLAAIFIVIAASWATFLTTFLVTFNNHTVAACCVVFALYPMARILEEELRKPLYFALAGFLAAFAATTELPAALFGVVSFGLLFHACRKQTLLYFVPAALIPLAAYFVANYAATGGWKPFYAYYGTEVYNYVYQGIPSYWHSPQGIDRGIDSPLVYLMHCTIGHHGILSLSPIFLLTVVGWLRVNRWNRVPLRPLIWAGLFLTLAVLAFYLTQTANYNYGGKTSALRWCFWLIPFWLLAMIPVLDGWGGRLWFRITATGLLMISIFSASYSRENPWQHPWLFVVMQDWGWIDYRDPSPPKFDPPLATWFRALPEVGQWTEPDWIELTGPDFDGQTMRIRLADAGTIDSESRQLRQIEITQARGDADPQTSTFTIDPTMFAEGLPPEEFLRWPAGVPSAERRTEAISLLRGLPKRKNYRVGTIRYLKTPLRSDAFRSQRAASQILFRPNDGDRFENTDEVDTSNERELRYRTDLWLSEEVPFGVLRVTTTVSDPKTGAIIARRTLTASAVSRIIETEAEAAATTDRTEEPESNADDN